MTTIDAKSMANLPMRRPATDGTADRIKPTIQDERRDVEKGAFDIGAKKISSLQNSVDIRPYPATVKFQGKISDVLVWDLKDIKTVDVWALPEDKFQFFVNLYNDLISANESILKSEHSEQILPDLSSDPRLKTFATVSSGGKVIAIIDNQGVLQTEGGALGTRIQEFLSSLSGQEKSLRSGPSIAQFRANAIADFFGGRIDKASTAMTQREFDALPPMKKPETIIDYDAMEKDPLSETIRRLRDALETLKQKRIDYLSQRS
jgi:hypothetical protein